MGNGMVVAIRIHTWKSLGASNSVSCPPNLAQLQEISLFIKGFALLEPAHKKNAQSDFHDKRPFCIWETCLSPLLRQLDLQCHFCWPGGSLLGLSGSRRSQEMSVWGQPQPGFANKDNTLPWRQFPAAALKHTRWECITQNCQSVWEPENCCFKCYSTGKSPLCTCCQKNDSLIYATLKLHYRAIQLGS